jgi:catechol 2,3-dioxygenase-like lactoylglutathione lyase family enzyme
LIGEFNVAVVLWVSDLQRSVDFYRNLFDVQDHYSSDGFASLGEGVNEVLLHLLPAEYRDSPSIGEENPIKPVFETDNLAKYSHLFRGEVINHGPWSYADLLDPDGHVIQLRQLN